MPATEKQYEQDSKTKGFQSEGHHIDYLEALADEYAYRKQRGDARAEEVADAIVAAGGDDPRKTTRRAAAKE